MKEYIDLAEAKSKAVYMHGFGQAKFVSVANLEKCKAADVVERKRGEWETSREIDWGGNLVYDHFHRGCGHTYTNHIESGANFCPNCGADMRSHQNILCDQTEEVEA